MNSVHNVIIIGGGCAGLTAALYCGRAELQPLVFTGDLNIKGGLLTKTSIVENYPGFPEGIDGYTLMTNMEDQARKYGATIIESLIIDVNFDTQPYALIDSENNTYYTKSVIIATGSSPNKLHLDNENKLWTKGISSCAVCDGALYKNKTIYVVGGGDSAFEEANFLTKFSNVTLIHRNDIFKASKAMQQKVFTNPKIKIITNTVISELHGDTKLSDITLLDTNTKQQNKMHCDGLFYGLGLKPNSNIFKKYITMDNEGYIIKIPNTKYETVTNIEGVFVAGDVADKHYRQAVLACGDGCKAALDVEHYLNNLE